ncbi:MAG: hypothetical protein QOJ40_2918, partial [Verrucomicrobiota bacterium]
RVCARWDPLNAFILRFAGVWRFFIFRPRAGLSIVNPFREMFSGNKLKDQNYVEV